MHYTKKAEVVEAEQYDGTNQDEMIALSPEFIKFENDWLMFDMSSGGGTWVPVSPNEWLYVDAAGKVGHSGEDFLSFWRPGGQPE